MKRLNGWDALMLYSEKPNVHQHTLKVAVLDLDPHLANDAPTPTPSSAKSRFGLVLGRALAREAWWASPQLLRTSDYAGAAIVGRREAQPDGGGHGAPTSGSSRVSPSRSWPRCQR